jgi:uncharacterized protein (UPF0332 family)
MNPREFWDLAITLLGTSAPADLRSAISRAYYATFHVAREFLLALGFQVPNAEKAHAFLWLRLSNCGDARVVDVGVRLNDLRSNRNVADYDLGHSISWPTAESDVRTAEDLIDILDALTPGPRLTQIRDAMIVYERDVLKDVTWRP